MKITTKLIIVMLLAFNLSFAQDKDAVLLTIDDTSVMASEFLRIYNKNLDLVKDENQKNIDNYLKLFIDYQLKLKEAKRLKLDEGAKYLSEFSSYKNQLIKKYISEPKVTSALVKEAYNRTNQDVNALHVLVRLDGASTDTVSAYTKILELRQRFIDEDFKTFKTDVHNGTSVFAEDLGYFSAFKMVYDFENAAYNTPIGEVSMPFRTQFGYHVVKVKDRRTSKGNITAAHIMVSLEQKDSLLDPAKRISDLYKKINQGENFEAVAKQFSDDKNSAKNGGKLKTFKSGELSSAIFEDQAFALKNNGDVSKPFKTKFGWHIVKRLDLKPLESFETLELSLVEKVKRDSRSKLINTAMINALKKRYDIKHNPEAKSYFTANIPKDYFTQKKEFPSYFQKEATLFKINNLTFTYKHFENHIIKVESSYSNKNLPIANIIDIEYTAFFEKALIKFSEDNLENENKEFAGVVSEYRDGLLLFDLMEKEVWNKASKDSIGLQAYYNTNKSSYNWKERVDIVMITSADKILVKQALKMIKKGKSEAEISSKFNSESTQNIIFTKGKFNTNDSVLPTTFVAKKGISDVYNHNEAYHGIEVIAILPASEKSLDDARGSVISDYQTQIEKNWISDLQKHSKVNINQNTLKAVKLKINN